MATTRREDEERTLAAGEFGKVLYIKAGPYWNMYYINDVTLQKLGVDIIMDTPEGPIYIDEKMAINQRHKNLLTYSLELSSENNRDKDGNAIGWFTSPDSKTTHYAFTWFQSDSAINVIDAWQTALVSKDAIKEMLREDGVNTDYIKDEFLGYVDLYKQHRDLVQAKDYLYYQMQNHTSIDAKTFAQIQKNFEERFGRQFDNTAFPYLADKIEYEYKKIWDEVESTCPALNKIHIREKEDCDGNVHSYEWKVGDYKLVQSVHLAEQPVNIVVPKEKLVRLADFIIDKDGNLISKNELTALNDLTVDRNGNFIHKDSSKTLTDFFITNDGNIISKQQLIECKEDIVNSRGYLASPYQIMKAIEASANSINVQDAIQKIHNASRPTFPALSQNQLKQLERGDRVPGELSFASSKYTRKTGKMRNAQDGDFIYIGKNPRDAKARVATYSKELGKWLVTHPDFPIKNNPQFIDIGSYIKNELLQDKIPAIFRTTDNLHRTIDVDRLKTPKHGDVAYLSGAETGGQRIMLTYNKFIDAYSLSSNNIINPKELPKFMGKDVIDDKILQLEKAVGERVIYGLRRALHDMGIKYKNATTADIESCLPEVLKSVQSSSWTSNRYSDVEAAMQNTTPKERSDLFKILNNPRLVSDLAKEITNMSRTDKYLAESVASVIYKPSRQREYDRLDREEADKRITVKALKTPPIKLDTFAMQEVPDVKTFNHVTCTGHNLQYVSWTPETIEKTAQLLNEQYNAEKPFVMTGKTPMWAAAAVMAQIDAPVYVKNNTYCVPVKNINSTPTFWQQEEGLETTRLTSQGLDFKLQRGVNALVVDVSPSATDKQYYFSEKNMQRLTIPEVDTPPKNVYLNTQRVGNREVEPVVLASLAKTYMDMGCEVYLYNGSCRAYSCINPECLLEPKRETDFAFDMYVGDSFPEMAQAQQVQTTTHEKEEKEMAFSR